MFVPAVVDKSGLLKSMTETEPSIWCRRVQIAFWVTGIACGAITAYTTRYFINGDALAYIEMGEALRTGEWIALANLTYSPGYPVLLGIAQVLLGTNPLNELQWLRVVNFFCFVLAMASCELLMFFVRREAEHKSEVGWGHFPVHWILALCYSMFLVSSLVFIRIRLLNPDMMVLAIVLLVSSILLWIREDATPKFKFVLLGIVTGIGYLTKSFFLPFSPIFFLVAGLCAGSWRKAVPRVLASILAMLLVAAPLIAALSSRLGRLTYGELGAHVYATIISGVGEPITPEVLSDSPKVLRFAYDVTCTRPAGFDIAYWHEGLKPVFNVEAQLRIIPGNVMAIFKDTPWIVLILIWYGFFILRGCVRMGHIIPPSIFYVLIIPALFGIGFYCLVRMEMRYIAPYVFLCFVALILSCRLRPNSSRSRGGSLGLSAVLVSFFLAMVAYSSFDQSLRGVVSTNKHLSYQGAFQEELLVKDFLQEKMIIVGDNVAVVGNPPVYWARMAGIKILAEVQSVEDFLACDQGLRKHVLDRLRQRKIRAIVGKGSSLAKLELDGWQRVPRTKDYFVYLLKSQQRP